MDLFVWPRLAAGQRSGSARPIFHRDSAYYSSNFLLSPVSRVAGSRGRRKGQLVRSPWRRLPLCPRCVGIFMVQSEGRDTARCSGPARRHPAWRTH
ncbi:hypothetical protein E2C01_024562 [Portunus trituberculatus]|uniref:Uncharacterized protein n=1 Tax=Portunus trituberculatus TaxID=210409 RepID=A0A5B7ED63_PORTR|nr:hypothetical protein [Portunus trituberculatus]